MNNVTALNASQHDARADVATAVNSFIARAGISKSATAREIGMSQSKFSRRITRMMRSRYRPRILDTTIA